MSESTDLFCVQLNDQLDCFEEVDEFVFANRKNCVKGSAYRYGECAFSRTDGTITFFGAFTPLLLSRAIRLLNISQPTITTNGWCHKVDSVIIKQKRNEILYEVSTKTRWKMVK